MFKKNNYKIVNNPEEADILVINTCGFIESAKEEGNKLDGMILEMAKKRKDLNERNAIYWNTGIYQRKKQDNRAKKVKYDGVVYDSISEMAEATGITKRRICYALKNKKRKFLDGKEISLA